MAHNDSKAFINYDWLLESKFFNRASYLINIEIFSRITNIWNNFINIEDVVQANIKACNPKQNGVYNVGTGNPRSFKDIADILQQELGTNLGTEYFPNPYPYDSYQMHTQADISTSQTNLGFNPVVSLEEGIKDYIPEIRRLHGTDIS